MKICEYIRFFFLRNFRVFIPYLKVVLINLLPWECGRILSSSGRQLLRSGSQSKAAEGFALCIAHLEIFSMLWSSAAVLHLRVYCHVKFAYACTNDALWWKLCLSVRNIGSELDVNCLYTIFMTILFQPPVIISTSQDYLLLTTYFCFKKTYFREMFHYICWSKCVVFNTRFH